MTAAPEPLTSEAAARPDPAIEQLKIANYYLRVALDQVPDGVVIFEAQLLEGGGPRVIFSNTPAASLRGADPAKGLRGLPLADLLAEDSDHQTLLAALRIAAVEGAAECECNLRTLYGSGPKRCRWSVRAVSNSMRKLLNFTLTFAPLPVAAAPAAQPRKADDLDTQCEQMRVKNLAELAKGIAHDVNNLLGPIAARLSEIIPNLPPESPLADELTRVFAGVRRAKQFTSQVVRASRAKARTGRSEPSDLATIIPETVELSQAGANVAVRTHLPENLDWVVADPVRVSQVVQNLVMNGIQAMPHGGYMDVEARNVEIAPGKDAMLRAGRYVEIIVRDRGTGIAPENMERLFHETFTTKADGNGIGLATCKRFVEENQGDIRVSSQLHVGTEFRVLLPAVPPPANAPVKPQRTTTAKPLPLQAGTGTVLMVDDEDELRRIACAILHRCGYRVFDCDNGQEALEIYRRLARQGSPPDVVLMDLTLRGGMSGVEAAAELLRFDPHARVVVTSGSVSEDAQMAFLEQGFVDVLPKPYEAGELSMMVRRVTMLPAPALASA